MTGGVLLGLGLPQSPQLPQLVLTSGQLVQGIQGAQVLIPTPQGEITSLIEIFHFNLIFKQESHHKRFSQFPYHNNYQQT